MTPPPIDLQRRVALDLARAHGVPLVTPDSPSALREAIAALVSLVSSRTYASLSAGASFYVPRLAGKIAGLVPAAVIPPLVSTLLDVAGIDLPASGVVLVSREAWDRHPLAVVAHELSHARRDATVAAGGVVASVLWGVGYLAHADVRAWEESTCRINDLVGLVVIDGLSVDDALPTAAGGVDAYALDTPARALYLAALDSAAASLRAGELPGEGTAIHRGLQGLVATGAWDAGPWAAAIDGERKTVTP